MHLALKFDSGKHLLRLIKEMSAQALEIAAKSKDICGYTLLGLLAGYSERNTFLTYIEKNRTGRFLCCYAIKQ